MSQWWACSRYFSGTTSFSFISTSSGVLPTARPCAISATAAMSMTSRVGLVGVSKKNVLVFGRTASRHWSRSVPSTSVEATP